MYTVSRVDQLDQLKAEAVSWNRLVECSHHLSPCSSYAWISSYCQHRLKNGEQWVCYFAQKGPELVGVLPLIVTSATGRLGGMHLLKLPSGPHTVSVDLVCNPDDAAMIIGMLVSRALEDFPRASCIVFSRIPVESPVLRWVRSGTHVPWHTIEWDGDGAYLSMRGSLDHYESGLSSRFRQDLRRHTRQIRELPGYAMRTLRGALALPELLSQFMQIEAANWKGQAGTAILGSEPLREYYATLVQRLFDSSWLRWDYIEADGNPIAAQLSFQLGSRLVLWKPAYDAKYQRYSPGTVLMHALIQSAFEDPGVEEVNLLSDYPYYAKWRVSLRPYYNVRLYRRTLPTYVSWYIPGRLRVGLHGIPLLPRAVRFVKKLGGKLRT